MKKVGVVALVALLVLGVAVIANANDDRAANYNPLGTPMRVVEEHLDALNNCDVDRLMAQYPPGIHILLPGGVTVEGRDDVRALFEGFCLPFPDGLAGLQFTEIESWTVHGTINAQWVADADFLCEPYYGADAYETWSGLMAAQVTTFDGAELVTVDENGACG